MLNETNKNIIDEMINEVLRSIKIQTKMISDMESELAFVFSEDNKAIKQGSIDLYEHKLKRNLEVLKVLKG